MTTTTARYQDVITSFAWGARIGIKYNDRTPAQAMDDVARDAIREAVDAHTRRPGTLWTAATPEMIAAADFRARVAQDILDGNDHPDGWNIRAAAIAAAANYAF